MKVVRFFALFALGAVGAHAGELPIIAKARAYLGADAALDAVRSLHLVGHIVIHQPGKPDTPVTFDQVFQKPCEESLTAVFKDRFFRKVLDDYDGWMRVQAHKPGEPLEFDDRRSPSLTILDVDEILSLRADAWENLSFYRGIESVDGSLKDLGPATVDHVACDEIEFQHPGGIAFYRYFDRATGRLVFTRTSKGSQIRESGYRVVSGIRFPAKIILTDRDAAGKEQTTTMFVDRVVVNQDFPESFFAMPLPPIADSSAPAESALAPAQPAASSSPASAVPPASTEP
ncbi:MAG: hypothetical protein ACREFX_10750 [Opitutaceae bacterium]